MPLRPNYRKVESDVCLRTYEINSKLEKERMCALKKVHEQMRHPAQVKLEGLTKNVGKWMVCMKKELEMIYSQCETCKVDLEDLQIYSQMQEENSLMQRLLKWQKDQDVVSSQLQEIVPT